MFVELVDRLRCTRPHADSWLVLAARRTVGRRVVDGVLGCPECRAEYPVRDGVADFRDPSRTPAANASAPSSALASADARTVPAGNALDGDEVVRLAALLALVDVRAPIVLAGDWGALAAALADAVPAMYVVMNAALPAGADERVSALLAHGALPLADGAAHGVALDAAAAGDAGLVAGAVRTLRAGGRLVAPASLALPAGMRELARDARHWVAERDAAPPVSRPVTLRRA